jgi:acyl-CoA synthetase (NDP forming)
LNASWPELRPLLAPRSVAVIGASTEPNKVGGMPIRLLRQHGYTGAVYPVHRTASEIQGLRAHPSLDAIGAPVDLALVAVPVAACDEAMDQLVRTGARAAIVFSSGFAETSDTGARLQRRLSERAREAGIVLLGPNCLGAMNFHERLFATFSPVVLNEAPTGGAVAMVSQSGAVGGYAYTLARRAGVGIGHWITTGNEAGVQVADAVHWLVREPGCGSILVYLEGARDLDRLRQALLAARAAAKPVTVVKVGHTPAGARAARWHTGSDTGDAQAYRQLFEACGVRQVSTIGELIGGATPLQAGPAAVKGTPIALFSVSGGVGIMMADRAEELGLALPPLPEPAAQRLKQAIPFASTLNPIDVTGQVFSQPAVLVQSLRDAARCGQYRALAVFLAAAAQAPGVWPLLQDCIAQLRADPGAARLVLSGILGAEQQAWLRAQGCPVFAEPAEAVNAAAA